MKTFYFVLFICFTSLVLCFFFGVAIADDLKTNNDETNPKNSNNKNASSFEGNQKTEGLLKSMSKNGIGAKETKEAKETYGESTVSENVDSSSGGNNDNFIPTYKKTLKIKYDNGDEQDEEEKLNESEYPALTSNKRYDQTAHEILKENDNKEAKGYLKNTFENQHLSGDHKDDLKNTPKEILQESITKASDALGIDSVLLNDIAKSEMFKNLIKNQEIQQLANSLNTAPSKNSPQESNVPNINKNENTFTENFMKHKQNAVPPIPYNKNQNVNLREKKNNPSDLKTNNTESVPGTIAIKEMEKQKNPDERNIVGEKKRDDIININGADNGNDDSNNNTTTNNNKVVSDYEEEEETSDEEEEETSDEEEEETSNDENNGIKLKNDSVNVNAFNSLEEWMKKKNENNKKDINSKTTTEDISKDNISYDNNQKKSELALNAEKIKKLNEIKEQLKKNLQKLGVNINDLKKKYENNIYSGGMLNKNKNKFSKILLDDFPNFSETNEKKNGSNKNPTLHSFKQQPIVPTIPNNNLLYEDIFLNDDDNSNNKNKNNNKNISSDISKRKSGHVTNAISRDKSYNQMNSIGTTQSEQEGVNGNGDDIFEEKEKDNYVNVNVDDDDDDDYYVDYKLESTNMDEESKDTSYFDSDFHHSYPNTHMFQRDVIDNKSHIEKNDKYKNKEVEETDDEYDDLESAEDIDEVKERPIGNNIDEQNKNYAFNAKNNIFRNKMISGGDMDDGNNETGKKNKRKQDVLTNERSSLEDVHKKVNKNKISVDVPIEIKKKNGTRENREDERLDDTVSIEVERQVNDTNINDNENEEDLLEEDNKFSDDGKQIDISEFKKSLEALSGNAVDSKTLNEIVKKYLDSKKKKESVKNEKKKKTEMESKKKKKGFKQKKKESIDYARLRDIDIKKLSLPGLSFYDVSPYADDEKSYNVNEGATVPNEQLQKFIKKGKHFHISYDPKNLDYVKQKKKEKKEDEEEDDDYDIYAQIKNSYDGFPPNYSHYAPQLIDGKMYVYTSPNDKKKGLIEYLKKKYQRKDKSKQKFTSGTKVSEFLKHSLHNNIVLEEDEVAPRTKNYAIDYNLNKKKSKKYAAHDRFVNDDDYDYDVENDDIEDDDAEDYDVIEGDDDVEDVDDVEDDKPISSNVLKKYVNQLLNLISGKGSSKKKRITVDMIMQLLKNLKPNFMVPLNQKPEKV